MYSQTLQEQTREYFKHLPFAAMKQYGGKFGLALFQDNQFIITDRKTDDKYYFDSIDALIEANWAID